MKRLPAFLLALGLMAQAFAAFASRASKDSFTGKWDQTGQIGVAREATFSGPIPRPSLS